MAKKVAVKTAPAIKKPDNKGIKPTIGYTLRTVPRTTWDRFRSRLDKEGRTVNWALNQFIQQYGENDEKVVLAVD
jgi:hypothetical protein